MSLSYSKQVEANGSGQITAFLDGQILTADSNHPAFNRISDWCERAATDDSVDTTGLVELFDVERALNVEFAQVTDRITIRGEEVFFDGDKVDNVLTKHLHKALEEGNQEWKAIARFWENIEENPNPHSREHIFRWLLAEDFAINNDGEIVGYKGVTHALGSIHHGPAVVNGKSVNGSVPNAPGSVITMGRTKVEHNPGVGCSVGLHVGTYNYAKGFGQVVMQVSVNPRDVVSVPTDCNDQKMRVCKYKVEGIFKGDKAYEGAVIGAEDYTTSTEVPTY